MTTKLVEPELITNPTRHQRLEQLKALADLMDGQFRIPGTELTFGLDAIIGLIPGIGDLVTGALSFWLIREAKRRGAPKWLIARMVWNVAVDVGVGVIPLVGDVFDAAWKANQKNVALLQRHFERHG